LRFSRDTLGKSQSYFQVRKTPLRIWLWEVVRASTGLNTGLNRITDHYERIIYLTKVTKANSSCEQNLGLLILRRWEFSYAAKDLIKDRMKHGKLFR